MPRNHSRRDVEPSFEIEPEPQSKQGFWVELGGGLLLICGLAGIGLYQWITEPPGANQAQAPTQASPSPSPQQATPTPRATPSPTKSALPTQDGSRSPALYQVMPKPGTYYAEIPALVSSRREIASNNGRFCIKLVNNSGTQPSDNPQIVISSLSDRKDGIYIDATQEKLIVDQSNSIIQDPLGTWQWLEGKVDSEGSMADCLASTVPYRQ
jgi:hypothetical protein